MDRLWAPWRIKYIRTCGKKENKKCVFCLAQRAKTKNYVIFKTKYSISLLNTFPYNNGHMMISPKRHIGEISELKEFEVLDLFKSLGKSKNILAMVLRPDGYNIGINISESAGAGIPEHLHIHLLPRWKGDTNFMPTLYDTKVISQSLDALYKQLKNATMILLKKPFCHE